MESQLISQIKQLTSPTNQAQEVIYDVWDNVQKLNTEFELNPHCVSYETINLLDSTADEFALLIKSVIHQKDESSRILGELSLKILKLCLILQRKIYFFQSRRNKLFSLN